MCEQLTAMFPDLSSLSDEQLFQLDETKDVHEINRIRHQPELLDRLAASLGPEDFFSHFRITLIRGHRANDAGEYDRTLDMLSAYLTRYAPCFHKFNPVVLNRFAISLLRLMGDTWLLKGNDAEAANHYLRILTLPRLERSRPFPLLVAASRVTMGAWMDFCHTGNPERLVQIGRGVELFRLGMEKAYQPDQQEFLTLEIGDMQQQVPKPHFFREVAREAAIMSEIIDKIHDAWNQDERFFFK